MKTKISLAQKVASKVGVDSGPANFWPVEAVELEPGLAKYNRTVQVKRRGQSPVSKSIGFIELCDLPAVIRARLNSYKRKNK